MQPFGFSRASDLRAAIDAGAVSSTAQQGASVRFLAGGTSLVDLLKLGVERPERLVDINRLGLDGIEAQPDGGLRVGATARNSDLAHHPLVQKSYPVLSQAILSGASAQLRNAATTAGNLLQRTRCVYFRDLASPCNKRAPGTGCAAIAGENRMMAILGASEFCIASHPSDMAVAMLAYDAAVHIQGPSGARSLALADFYLTPGDRPDLENVLGPGDLITHVALPAHEARERGCYLKLRDRASYEFALVSAAVALTIQDGRIAGARLALGGVGTKPWRRPEAERVLLGQRPEADVFRDAAHVALEGARPQSRNAFKTELAKRCVIHAFAQVAGFGTP